MKICGILSDKVKLDEGESVLKESRASLQTDFIIPLGGRLYLTSRRLIFIPCKLSISPDRLETIVINLSEVSAAEKKKGDMSNLLAGSFRSRLHIRAGDRSYIFQVWGLDDWLERIKESIKNELHQ